MKRRIHNFIRIGILAAVLYTLPGCCPLWKDHLGEIKLTETDKLWIPYRGSESLSFTGPGAASMVFTVGKREQITLEENTSAKESCEYYTTQTESVSLQSDNGEINFKIEIKAKDTYETKYEPFLNITSHPNQMEMVNYFIFPAGLDKMCESTNENLTCLQTLSIGGKTYNQVLKLENKVYYMNGTTEMVKTVYYSKENGLIQFELDNGDVWVLKN